MDRLNLGSEERVLKLGDTFTAGAHARTAFHTLKYDFKPASVDLSKVATLDVSGNNQVTVTVPNIDSSGQPQTVFKGNQRNYTKECVLIIDKVTGEITLERLHHNIQVKKTRAEGKSSSGGNGGNGGGSMNGSQANGNGGGGGGNNGASSAGSVAAPGGPGAQRVKLENSTQRTVSKTRVSTGQRKSNLGGIVQRHSPLQGSPSYPHHKSPQQAPAWNANNTQSTLPSIPLIGMDDDIIMPTAPAPTSNHHHQNNHNNHQNNHHDNHQQQQQSPRYPPNKQPTPPQQQQQHHHNAINHPQRTTPNHYQPQSQQQQQQQQLLQPHQNQNQQSLQHRNTSPLATNHNQQLLTQHNTLPGAQSGDVGVLSSSSSSSSSGSDSSDSGSDSENEEETMAAAAAATANNLTQPGFVGHQPPQAMMTQFLDDDLRLSDSNSSDSD